MLWAAGSVELHGLLQRCHVQQGTLQALHDYLSCLTLLGPPKKSRISANHQNHDALALNVPHETLAHEDPVLGDVKHIAKSSLRSLT